MIKMHLAFPVKFDVTIGMNRVRELISRGEINDNNIKKKKSEAVECSAMGLGISIRFEMLASNFKER